MIFSECFSEASADNYNIFKEESLKNTQKARLRAGSYYSDLVLLFIVLKFPRARAKI